MSVSVKTILIADDDEDLRLLVQVTLENSTYRILTAKDGLQAMNVVKDNIPDLLIIDWMMPRLNGYEVVSQLRQNPHTITLPVVMLTAKDSRDSREQMAPLALSGYLVKPFSPLELINKVKEILER